MMDRETWLKRILDATRDLADVIRSASGSAAKGPRSIRAPRRSCGSWTTTTSRASSPKLQRRPGFRTNSSCRYGGSTQRLRATPLTTRHVAMRPASRAGNGSESESLPGRRSTHFKYPRPPQGRRVPGRLRPVDLRARRYGAQPGAGQARAARTRPGAAAHHRPRPDAAFPALNGLTLHPDLAGASSVGSDPATNRCPTPRRGGAPVTRRRDPRVAQQPAGGASLALNMSARRVLSTIRNPGRS